MSNKTINLFIEKITLDGLGQLNRGQLRLAIETELHRLLTDQALFPSLNHSAMINQITTKPIELPNQVRERSLGHKIANSVYRGLRR